MAEEVSIPKPPPAALEQKLTPDEIEAFYDHSSPRAMAIVLGAIIEDHLTALLRLLMRRDKTLADELFKPTGPIGPFGTKIRVAYMLRIIDERLYKDLLIVSRIRNRFAHDLAVKNFDDPQIAAWVKNLHMYTTLKEMAAIAKERAKPGDMLSIAHHLILSNSLLSARDSYRECCRNFIHHLVDFENGIKAKEAEMNAKRQPASPEPSPEKP